MAEPSFRCQSFSPCSVQ